VLPVVVRVPAAMRVASAPVAGAVAVVAPVAVAVVLPVDAYVNFLFYTLPSLATELRD
jgi:hypothetical protein